MNEIEIKNNQMIVANEIINGVKEIENRIKLLKEKQENMKSKFLKAMEENNIKSWTSPDETLKITRVEGGITTRFDSNRFEKEHHDLYVEYQKDVKVKSSLRITVRSDKNE